VTKFSPYLTKASLLKAEQTALINK